ADSIMAFTTVIVCCLLIAVAISSPLDERSAGVKVVQLNKAQEKQAADSLITILEGTVTKLKDAEADSARRSADSQGLEVTVDSDADLTRRAAAGGRVCVRWKILGSKGRICVEWS
ncbi:hypothetical protein BaRGS_00009825, partial [Batillaria attramentaria]